jgi:Ca2+-binding EF-hand superfamily protein
MSTGSTSSLYDLETLFLEKLQEKYKLNIRDVKRAFARFDLDHNGLLDLRELVQGNLNLRFA